MSRPRSSWRISNRTLSACRDRLTGHLVVPATDEPLRRVDGALRIQNRLAARELARKTLTLLGEGHHRWSGTRALGVGNDRRLAPFDGRDNRMERVRQTAGYAYVKGRRMTSWTDRPVDKSASPTP